MVARILVVEEHAQSLVLMLHVLKGRGYSTVFATEVGAAVSLARDERPDLIVLDWRLSCDDGRQGVLQVLREDRLRGVPLVAVVDVCRLEVVGGRRTPAGFADYVAKPIDPQSFLGTVERHIPEPLRALRSPLRLRGQRRRSDHLPPP
jgi:two-component system cell cycle response regulator